MESIKAPQSNTNIIYIGFVCILLSYLLSLCPDASTKLILVVLLVLIGIIIYIAFLYYRILENTRNQEIIIDNLLKLTGNEDDKDFIIEEDESNNYIDEEP